jgi:hypothetical protein
MMPRMQCSGLVYLGLETGHLEYSYSSKTSVMKEHQYRLDVKSAHVAPDIVNLGTG